MGYFENQKYVDCTISLIFYKSWQQIILVHPNSSEEIKDGFRVPWLHRYILWEPAPGYRQLFEH